MAKFDFSPHRELNGKHSRLSPSGPTWLRYDDETMYRRFMTEKKKAEGTYLHDLAQRMIITKTQCRDLKKAFNMFVNDAIGFGMESEVILKYSDNAFGTADAIKFTPQGKTKGHLQIHDLKTGVSKPHWDQLFVYAALFCLEYGYKPTNLTFQCRLYQGNGWTEEEPEPEYIAEIMETIKRLDIVINTARQETGGLFGQ